MADDDVDIDEKVNEKMFDSQSVDQLESERGKCLESNCEVRKVFLELKECTIRVYKKRRYTAETCNQEMMDLMEALDHCVGDIAFSKLI